MTDIVEVRFIKDTQSVQTGNEFYPSGATAHFFANQASALIEQGQAVLCDDPPIIESVSPPPAPDYSGLTVKQLKAAMYEAGIPISAKMRKADLIAALKGQADE